MQETWVRTLGWEDPWRRKWQLTPVFLPGESHGGRSLVGYSPRGHKESDTTKLLHLLFLRHYSESLLKWERLQKWRASSAWRWCFRRRLCVTVFRQKTDVLDFMILCWGGRQGRRGRECYLQPTWVFSFWSYEGIESILVCVSIFTPFTKSSLCLSYFLLHCQHWSYFWILNLWIMSSFQIQ